MISTFTILFVALLTIVGIRKTVQWIRARQFSKSQGCKPPPSEGQFDLLGVLNLISLVRHHLKRTALSNTIRRFEKYGETFDSKLLAQNIYWTCNARNIKQVLTIRFADYDAAFGRAHLFRPITEHGILVLDGPKWKAARDVYRNQFSNTRSIVDLDMFEYHVQTFLRNVTTADGPINLAPLFLSLVQDITTEFVLGESADTLSPTQSIDKKRFIESLMFVKKIIARDGYLGAMHVFFSKKAYHQACNDVKRFVEPIIEKELDRQMQHRKGDVLENSATRYFMLKGMADNTDSKLELRDGTISVLLAGIDSVESLLDMTFWLLARNREVFAKLRTEVLDNIGRNRPTYDQLKNLTYLRYVFNETLRLFPPVPLNARIANKDTTLPCGGGADRASKIFVSKGQTIVYSSWASHRNSKIFGEDAHDFNPERWKIMRADSLGYVPFSSGPRVCPGQQFALMESSYIVVRILQTISGIENRDTRPWIEDIGMTLLNENGVLVGLTKDCQVEKI